MPPKEVQTDTEKDERANMPQFHAMSPEKACAALEVAHPDLACQNGLTTKEAQARLERYGENKLSEKERVTLLQRIWKQVSNVLVGILVFVAVVSLIKGIVTDKTDDKITNFIEVGLITFVITLNTTIGIYQEGSAEAAAEALKNMLSADAVLVRDGKEVKIPAKEVVPGDIVILNTGDRIPADIRLLEVNNISSLEAALTGESVPIDKSTGAIVVEGQDPRQTPLGDRKNMCFSATLVSQGYAKGLVVTTGDHTEIGNINQLVNKSETKKTAVLEQIDFIAKVLACFIAVTAVTTWLAAFFRIDASPVDALSIALVCAVAMIPEGLEAIVTMTYSWSVSTMANHNAIIRVLPAVETLGSVTTICSDKTGTLTKNEMSLVAFVTSNAHYKFDVDSKSRSPTNFQRDDTYLAARAGETANVDISKADSVPVSNGQSPSATFVRNAIAGGVLCSKCTLGKNGGREGEIGNPTELAILRAAYFSDIGVSEMKSGAPILAEVPFNSAYKFMATVHAPVPENDGNEFDGMYVAHVKGAPDRMIKHCKYQAKAGQLGEKEPIDSEYWASQIAILSSHGLRCLALCRGAVPKDSVSKGDQLKPEWVSGRDEPWLTIMGVCAIQDPPRPECIDAIATAHKAGVRVAMITGDHKDTAIAIGTQLGIVNEKYSSAITGPEFDSLSAEEIKMAVMKYNVFARASPENKIEIVKALQMQGEVCSMTGDGVNDAPALKAADMGVAMGKEGTDVAREASEMILADDNFATIVTAVREGRVVWDNLRKVLLINTPINNAQGMSVLFGILCGLDDAPLTPIQVLYCNLICAVTLGFVAAVEPAEDGIMSKPPRRVGKRLIGRFLLMRIILGTAALVASTVGAVFIIQARDEYGTDDYHSQALNTLSFGAISITMSARFSYNSSFHPRSFYGNPIALYSYATMALLQVFITYVPGVNEIIFKMAPMDVFQWLIVVVFMVVVFIVMEVEKTIRRYLSSLGEDTDDMNYDPNFDGTGTQHRIQNSEPTPKSNLGLSKNPH